MRLRERFDSATSDPAGAFAFGQGVTYLCAAISVAICLLQAMEAPPSPEALSGMYSSFPVWIVLGAGLVFAGAFAWLSGLYFKHGARLSQVASGVDASRYYLLRQLGAVLVTFSFAILAAGFTPAMATSWVAQILGLVALSAGAAAIVLSDWEGDLSSSQSSWLERWLSVVTAGAFLAPAVVWFSIVKSYELPVSIALTAVLLGSGLVFALSLGWCIFKAVKRRGRSGNRTSASTPTRRPLR